MQTDTKIYCLTPQTIPQCVAIRVGLLIFELNDAIIGVEKNRTIENGTQSNFLEGKGYHSFEKLA
jgi:hypothetical protein